MRDDARPRGQVRAPAPRVVDLAMESSLSVAAVNHILRHPDRAAAEVLDRLLAAARRLDFSLPDHVMDHRRAGVAADVRPRVELGRH